MRRLPLAAIGLVMAVNAWSQMSVPPEGRVASVNGFEIYYEIHGQGRPLVLLHQFNGSGGRGNCRRRRLPSTSRSSGRPVRWDK